MRENYPATLEPPLENAGHQKSKKNYQERSGVSMIFLKGQGVGNISCKNKQNQTGYIPNIMYTLVTIGGDAALPTNSEKGLAGKCKTNYSDRLKYE